MFTERIMAERTGTWGYRVDRPAPVGHVWQWVQSGKVVKVQPICGCMHPIHELQVAWADRPIRRPCLVCAEVSGLETE